MKPLGRVLFIGAGLVGSLQVLRAQTGTTGSWEVASLTASNLATLVAAVAQTTPIPAESVPKNGLLYLSAQHPE